MTLANSTGDVSAGAVTLGATFAATFAVTLIRGAELVAAPWKNGGGVTREVAAFPANAGLDTFVWRVSVADVAQAGPFSRFAGIDRTLVLLGGAGMLLDEAQSDEAVKTHALTQALDVARFAGEARIEARLVDGATRDFNLMVRRDAAQAELEVWRLVQEQAQQQAQHQAQQDRSLSADVALLYCADGKLAVTLGDAPAQTQLLQPGDTLRIDSPNRLACKIEGAGALLAISIRYAPR